MDQQNGEIHVETDEARGGRTTGVVRYVLVISLILAIGILSLVWITGALSQGDTEEEATVSGTALDETQGDQTDSLILPPEDDLATDPAGVETPATEEPAAPAE